MKPSKLAVISMNSPLSPPSIRSLADLRQLQRVMSAALFRPLTARDGMQPVWEDGRSTEEVVAGFIRPNERLTSFDRLEIYNRQYWFRLLDCLHDDYPGLRSLLGQRKFHRLCRAYLARCPSASWTLRDLGRRLPRFIQDEPDLTAPRTAMAVDMTRFEWAQVVAFDEAQKPPLHVDELLGSDPEKLRLGLQPHLSILGLDHTVDDYFMALRHEESRLRDAASNGQNPVRRRNPGRRVAMPRQQPVFLAVHRCDSEIFFKRLDPEACLLLQALRDGRTLHEAVECALAHATPSHDWSARIGGWFENWAALGWFCALSETSHPAT